MTLKDIHVIKNIKLSKYTFINNKLIMLIRKEIVISYNLYVLLLFVKLSMFWNLPKYRYSTNSNNILPIHESYQLIVM